MSSSTKHFLDRFATTVRIDDYDTLYHYLLRWMMDHRPPNPRFCSLRAISKSKITWAHEEDALKSVKGDETQDTKFVNYQYIVNQPPISLQSAYSHSKARTSSNIMASGSYSAHCIASKNQYTQLMKDRGYIQLQYIGASVDSLHGLLQEAQSYNPDEITMVTTVYRSICGSETASRWSNFNTRPSRDISAVNIR
ncbi:hypothetical protein N7519_007500 [Penicillium mononematosum]|uniref:uncharacterized protein n=1 Tax=Penicillium mononematosum TaxID=268346 RepID=UPI002547B6E9|nr:uncharacterized protein N7519_007500 [Penicillium mononematosum]KAJ6186199.1 hypothetical protein N7519_007500 [Penicillium mononematosum]